MENYVIRGDRLALFLRAIRTPTREPLVRTPEERGPAPLSARKVQDTAGVRDSDIWADVWLDSALILLSEIVYENLDELGSAMLKAEAVKAYLEAMHAPLLPFFEIVGRGEITEADLKEPETENS